MDDKPTGNGFRFLNSGFTEAMRSYAEQERRLAEYFERMRVPALDLGASWEAANRTLRGFEEMARRYSEPMALPGLESALSAAKAFGELTAPFRIRESALEGLERSATVIQHLYDQVSSAALMTSRIEQSIAEASRVTSWIKAFEDPLARLRKSGAEVYDAFAREPASMLRISDWILQAPAITPYRASLSVAVMGRAKLPDLLGEAELDAAVDDGGGAIERRLRTVSPALLVPYRGAIAALEVQGPDWARHFGVSVRTLVGELILKLAPDKLVDAFLPNAASYKEDGEFTRRARLKYIFRDVAHGAYARLADENIDMILATFFPAQTAVHELLPALDSKQARVFVRHMEGCLLMILETVSD